MVLDNECGIRNMENTCAISALTEAVLPLIVERHSRVTAVWDAAVGTRLNALTGARTERGPDKRVRVSETLCKAVADGCDDAPYLQVGHTYGQVGQLLDIEEIRVRCLELLWSQDAAATDDIRCVARRKRRFNHPECRRHMVDVPSTRAHNPILMNPHKEEISTTLRNTLSRLVAAPQPCRSCARDSVLMAFEDADSPPPFLICHVGRAVQGTKERDRSRVHFVDQLKVRDTWYGLQTLVQYTEPGSEGAMQGGHYTAYAKTPEGIWVLHDDMYSRELAPVLDDPAISTALYVRQSLQPSGTPSLGLRARRDSSPRAPSPPRGVSPPQPSAGVPANPAGTTDAPPTPSGRQGDATAGAEGDMAGTDIGGQSAGQQAAVSTPTEESGGRSPLPDDWLGDGPTMGSSYSSREESQCSWPRPPKNTPGGRAAEEEIRMYRLLLHAIDFREQWWCDTNQRGEPQLLHHLSSPQLDGPGSAA